MKLNDDINVQDTLTITRRRPGGGSETRRVVGPGAPPIGLDVKLASNVTISLIDPKTGKVVEKRRSHNIFIDYGRDWITHLIALNVSNTDFRDDKLKWMALGIGGTAQHVPADDIRNPSIYNHPGYPNEWVAGSGGTGDPTQTNTNPSVIALEWPIEITSGVYYDTIRQPATFPDTGTVRLTTVLGINEVSYDTSHADVPLSEIGLFTEGVTDTSIAPVDTGAPPLEKYMVAYNQFSTLSKTSGFVMQIDWELRFR